LSFLSNLFRKRYPSSIEKKIGYLFSHPELLTTALTHRSAASCQSNSYERLEFLGDAVLDLVVSDYLFQKYKDESEGKLTQMRSILVNAQTLHEVAKSLNLHNDLNVDIHRLSKIYFPVPWKQSSELSIWTAGFIPPASSSIDLSYPARFTIRQYPIITTKVSYWNIARKIMPNYPSSKRKT